MSYMNYEERLEAAKRLYKLSNAEQRTALECIFPELCGSEDEKIRKWLIDTLKGYHHLFEEGGVTKEDMLAWLEKQGGYSIKWNKNTKDNKPQINHSVLMLTKSGISEGEWIGGNQWSQYRWSSIVRDSDVTGWMELSALKKQGEQKSVDKVEPKFKIGDWITNGQYAKLIVGVNSGWLFYIFKDGKSERVKDIDKKYHLWTIQDAKPGDVLATEPIDSYPFPFVAIYKNRGLDFFNSYCFIGFDGKFYNGETGHSIEDIYPATKEQRDTLIKAMADAGYAFDFEEKELKKIEQNLEMVEALRTEYEKGRADAIADTLSWLANCWPQYCDNPNIIKAFEEAIKKD